MKKSYLNNDLSGTQKEAYAQIFDRTIESSIDAKLDANDYKRRDSHGTSMLAR